MVASLDCIANSDNQFGPRIDTDCRVFDFTLLFEDTFFTILPATLFLLLLPLRLRTLCRAPSKVTTYRLAIYKLVSEGILLSLNGF